MNRYELVVLIDPKLSWEDIKAKKGEVEKLITSSKWEIEEIDDIGFLDLGFAINKEQRAYFYSICTKLDNESMDSIKKALKVMVGINRWKLFRMADKEVFLKYSEVNKVALKEEEKEDGAFHEINRS